MFSITSAGGVLSITELAAEEDAPLEVCCLMTSKSFGCHDISRHRCGGLSGCDGVARCAGRGGPGRPQPSWLVFGVYCTRVGGYWERFGCTPQGWGFRAVGTTLSQYTPTLVQ